MTYLELFVQTAGIGDTLLFQKGDTQLVCPLSPYHRHETGTHKYPPQVTPKAFQGAATSLAPRSQLATLKQPWSEPYS